MEKIAVDVYRPVNKEGETTVRSFAVAQRTLFFSVDDE